MGDQVRADLPVAFGGLRVVAHDEPLGPRARLAVPRGDVDLFDPQVVRDVVVAVGAAQRGGGLGLVWRSFSAWM